MLATLRLIASLIGRSERQTSASGVMPIVRSACTECCVGLVFSSPLGPMYGMRLTCRKKHRSRPTSWRTWRAASRNGSDSMSPTVPPTSVMTTSTSSVAERADAVLDLVGDVRDDLDGVAEVLAAPLLGDDGAVDLAGRDVGAAVQVLVEEALVVADVEVGLGAVVGDEDLAVLERVHRPGVDVEVRVELLHRHPQAAGLEQPAEAGRRQALAERGGDATGDEQVAGGGGPAGASDPSCSYHARGSRALVRLRRRARSGPLHGSPVYAPSARERHARHDGDRRRDRDEQGQRGHGRAAVVDGEADRGEQPDGEQAVPQAGSAASARRSGGGGRSTSYTAAGRPPAAAAAVTGLASSRSSTASALRRSRSPAVPSRTSAAKRPRWVRSAAAGRGRAARRP